MNSLARAVELLPRDPDALEIGALYRSSKASIVESVKYLIEAGQLLLTKKENLLHGEWLPWLAANATDLAFDTPRTAQRLMDLARKYDASVAFEEGAATQICRAVWGHDTSPRTLGTGEVEWYTPEKFIELARSVMGGIDLDPASSDLAQQTVKAERYFTKENDGLRQGWGGRVWLNPPYSQPAISDFIGKLLDEVADGRVTQAVLLTHNFTDAAWFHKACEIADALCFTRGRIKFMGQGDAPPCGQTFYYFGQNVGGFAATFLEVGTIITPFCGEV